MEKVRRNRVKYLPSYSITLDNGRTLKIKPTANAWWKREPRVHLLLASLREGYKIPEACKQVGINLRQYKYFARLHPEVSEIRKYYKVQLIEKARGSIARAVERDKRFALKYLMKTKPEEFPSPKLLNEIKELEEDLEYERKGYLEELRQVKYILGIYAEVANELKPQLGGWYLQQVKRAEGLVQKYNALHKSSRKRIPRHPSKSGGKSQ